MVKTKKSTIVVGIDPGLSGGVAIIDAPLSVCHTMAMPTLSRGGGKKDVDIALLRDFIVTTIIRAPDLIILEEPIAMPKQSSTSTLTSGRNYGKLVALAQLMGWPFEEVKSQLWKRVVLAGTKKEKDDAIAYVRKRFPKVGLMFGRSRKPHDGVADAVCIAEYGRRLLNGGA